MSGKKRPSPNDLVKELSFIITRNQKNYYFCNIKFYPLTKSTQVALLAHGLTSAHSSTFTAHVGPVKPG
jgi:hypothetical protein